ncbi:MAG: hypothetical protein JO339_06630 [Alphaproteobacteria bacterium]|nr:hypothetical protein [Alphaproteobacteria bacterium]
MSNRITLRKVLGWLVLAVLTFLTLAFVLLSAMFSGFGSGSEVLCVLWFFAALYFAMGP